jgi:hypothetical protein
MIHQSETERCYGSYWLEKCAPKVPDSLFSQDDPGDVGASRGLAEPHGGSDMSKRSRNAVADSGRASSRRVGAIRDEWIEAMGQRVVRMFDGCWIMDGKPDTYARVVVGGKQDAAHRVAFELLTDVDLASDLDVHHACLHPGCINPAHLVAMTRAEHVTEHKRLRAA